MNCTNQQQSSVLFYRKGIKSLYKGNSVLTSQPNLYFPVYPWGVMLI